MEKLRPILIFFILTLGIANGLLTLRVAWDRRSDPDLVGESERRYGWLHQEPNFPQELSYAGNPDAFRVDDQCGFRLMQYSLAPILVSDRLDQEWLIWNGPTPIRGEPSLRGYSPSRKLGEGLYLYHREEP